VPSRYTSTGRAVALGGVDEDAAWLALLQANAYEAWDGAQGIAPDRLTWTGCVLGRVVTSTSAPGATTLGGRQAVSITAAGQGYRRATADVIIANPFSIVAVFDATNIATETQMAFSTETGVYYAVHTGSPVVTKWYDNAFRGDAAPTLGAQVMRWTQTGTTTSVYRNGVLIASGTGTQRNIGGGCGVFGANFGAFNALRGICAHLSLYASEANAATVAAAARAYYGI
jgi:hypothetical protein